MQKLDSKLDIDDPWDDTLLLKAYEESIKLTRGDLARRIASSTSKIVSCRTEDGKSNSVRTKVDKAINEYKVGDYVRATYEDGVDYEAKILAIDEESGTCNLKYIGYENEQEVPLDNLIPSWGKNARRLQFAKARVEETDEVFSKDSAGCRTSGRNCAINQKTIPPPPPMPPMLSSSQNSADSEHLSAMLMSWYMSGYYTGVYQGIQMAKSKNKKH